jgi:HD-GYP domain-containing protein (c-di-GMP phosphodiesterase class II)
MIRLGKNDLTLGAPAPFDIYDGAGKLLLKKGYILETDHQLTVLANTGLYCRESHKPVSPIVVLQRELKLHDNLSRIIRNKVACPDIETRYMNSALTILNTIQQDRNISLAFVFFSKTPDNYPLQHSLDTAIVSACLGLSLGLARNDLLDIIAASLTMNISMLNLQQQLHAKTETLSADERIKISNHPAMSRTLLEQAGITSAKWLDYVLCHHEKIDGSGYPAKLTGDRIPEGARLIGFADRYMAMVSPRQYRAGLMPAAVMKKLLLHEGNTLDLNHIGALTRAIGIYPPGTVTKLRNGETAIVTASGGLGASPRVRAFLDADGKPLPRPLPRDTATGGQRIVEAIHLAKENIPFDLITLSGQDFHE